MCLGPFVLFKNYLEKKNAIEKSFSGWWASGDVYINWYNSINTSDNGITKIELAIYVNTFYPLDSPVVIITTPIST